MKRFVIMIAMAALFFLPVIALAEKLVFVTSEWPPYVFVENGQPTGVNVDIVRETCKRLSIEPEIQLLPWKRAVRYVKEGRADAIFSPVRNEKRAEFLYFPSEPLKKGKIIVAAKKGSGIRIAGLDDLRDKKIGIVAGYVYDPSFDNYQKLRKYGCDDNEQLARILDKGRVDVAVFEEANMKFYCKKEGLKDCFEEVHIISEYQNYVAFSKTAGDKNKSLAEKFGQALAELKKEGVIQKIESRYF